jgi:hypothetical protein
MDQTKRQQEIERICRHYGKDTDHVTAAARHLGQFRSMTVDEVESNLTALEDEVVQHLQVSQAINLTNDFFVG